ncbi:hypothetical protein JR739_004401 [Escherichia coli]|nr:hypothetical protein [Escherichia coli]EFB5489019.1 hypothetical protein [Escherichia coli]EHD1192274.1 hypothetical protein [Escherichia coli]
MHSQLKERIRLMRARLDNAAPVAEIRAESQLFVTPAPVCDRLVTLAEISNRDHILEPSAGTGAILRAIRDTAPGAMCDAVEINSGLVRYQSSLDAETLLKQLWQINDELGELLDSVENHTPVIRKKASDLSALMMLFSQQAGQPMTMLLIC